MATTAPSASTSSCMTRSPAAAPTAAARPKRTHSARNPDCSAHRLSWRDAERVECPGDVGRIAVVDPPDGGSRGSEVLRPPFEGAAELAGSCGEVGGVVLRQRSPGRRDSLRDVGRQRPTEPAVGGEAIEIDESRARSIQPPDDRLGHGGPVARLCDHVEVVGRERTLPDATDPLDRGRTPSHAVDLEGRAADQCAIGVEGEHDERAGRGVVDPPAAEERAGQRLASSQVIPGIGQVAELGPLRQLHGE